MDSADQHDTLRRLAAACILEGMEEAGLASIPPSALPPAAATTAAAPQVQGTGLNERIEACRNCPLGTTRNCAVPGEGAEKARILFVGEAPDEADDRSGRPIMGPAGELLDKIVRSGMGLKREVVFITNILKCRPPESRTPLANEVDACTPFLEEQISAIQPDLIIALGQNAAQHLLRTKDSLSRLRGELQRRPQGGPPVLVTYHPAYLLRHPEQKRACWEDIQLGLRHLGLPQPGA